MNPLPLDLDRVRKSFDERQVLLGVDLQVAPGTVLGLLGQNGSGKTTLLKCALGLLRITGGSARVYGEEAWDLSAEVKSRIGYVPQEMETYPWMRVRQMIAYTAAFYPTWNQPLVDELCRRWHLPLEERTGTLSVGQLHALGIVLAMGHEPDLLVLDEPVAGLDPAARRQFLRTLLEVLEDPARTIVFSSHITSDLERVADHVALLRDGKVLLQGELGEVKDRVKRLTIVAAEPFATRPDFTGATNCQVEGNVATITVSDFSEELVARLRRDWRAEVSVTDLNLEEMFIELHEDETCAAPV